MEGCEGGVSVGHDTVVVGTGQLRVVIQLAPNRILVNNGTRSDVPTGQDRVRGVPH